MRFRLTGPETPKADAVIARKRRMALRDAGLVFLAAFAIAVSVSPKPPLRQMVSVRDQDGLAQTYYLPIDDPRLDRIGRRIEQYGRSIPVAQVALAKWQAETAQFYVARLEARTAARAPALPGQNEFTGQLEPTGQNEFTGQNESAGQLGLTGPFEANGQAAPTETASDDSSDQTEVMEAGFRMPDEPRLPEPSPEPAETSPPQLAPSLADQISARQVTQYWNHVHTQSLGRLASLNDAADQRLASIGPPPIELGQVSRAPQSQATVGLCGLVAVAAVMLMSLWTAVQPKLVLVTRSSGRPSEASIESQSQTLELPVVVPAAWVSVHQPLGVHLRQWTYLGLVATAITVVARHWIP